MAIAGNPSGAPTFTVTFFTSLASSLLSSSVLLQPTKRDDVSKKDIYNAGLNLKRLFKD